MTVALVWILIIFGGPTEPPSVIDALPTQQHCRAMQLEVLRRHPAITKPYSICLQRQMVIAEHR